MSPYEPQSSSDTVEVAELVRTIKSQWRAVAGFLALGVLGAAAIVLFAPRQFEGKATVLARPGTGSTGSISGRITGLGELLGGIGGVGGLGGGMETELQLMRSRAVAGQLSDSLLLQVRVREPEGTPALALFEEISLPGSFKPRKYRFERSERGTYRTTSNDTTYELTPGQPSRIDVGSLTLRPAPLPPSFTLKLLDREDAITRTSARLTVTKAGGDIARIVYRGDDSVTAAAGANALVSFYLERRKTTDRGVNQRRLEYVTAQFDSTAAELARTERELREYQERSRVLDAEVQGQVEMESAALLRQSLTEAQVDEGAIKQLLIAADSGRITSRDLAAYPQFLRGSSVSPLVGQLSTLETQRVALLERRTERDPEVQALDASMRAVEANIIGIARSYAGAVTRQRQELQQRHDSIQSSLLALPAAAERGGRLQRDVKRLTQIFTALEAQVIEARLAAIGEGGDIRPVDVAVPQRAPAFPKPLLTMGIGTAGGLLMGMIAALFLGWFGRWLRDPREIERATGLIAQRFDAEAPMLVAGPMAGGTRTIVVVPLDSQARVGTVVERLARTARQRSMRAEILDLSGPHPVNVGNGNGAGDGVAIGNIVDRLEQDEGMVIVQLPSLSSEAAAAVLRETRPVLLVAPPGPVDRTRLTRAVETLRQLHVPCAGVVISDGPERQRVLT